MNYIYELIIVLYLLFGGCCSSVMTMESIIKIQKNCGYLVTMSQFIFIALEGFIRNIRFKNPFRRRTFPITLKRRKVPIYKWFIMVILFFATSVLNNMVFSYNISIPIHIIFRSSSISINMLMSWLILKRKYSIQQILSIVIVTIGLMITTLSSAKQQKEVKVQETNILNWIKGIVILFISSIIGALMGIYQEYVFKQHPNSWKECLFYKHLLSIPIFALLIPQIKEQWQLFKESPINPLGHYIPILNQPLSDVQIQGVWLLLGLNIITQYVCIASVQKLSSICSSVTLNLILNIRKFISLIISVIFYKNPFSLWSWFGSIFVFVGVLLYVKASDMLKKKQKKEINNLDKKFENEE